MVLACKVQTIPELFSSMDNTQSFLYIVANVALNGLVWPEIWQIDFVF
jgi:hypothetical protein